MTFMKKSITTIIGLSLLLAPSLSYAKKPDFAKAAKPGKETITEIVITNPDIDEDGEGDFDVLLAAVSEAGLVGALNRKRQLTVFAPTDAAFATALGVSEADLDAAIEGGVVGETVKDLTGLELTDILLYHVIPGRHTSNGVLSRDSYRTLGGERLTQAELSTAGVVPANISAKNGVVHVLTEGVLLP